MKKISRITVILIAFLTIFSCSKKLQDDQLSGFLLLGPYTISFKPDAMEVLSDDLSDEDMLVAYKQIFEFPYATSDSSIAKEILLRDFNAIDKATTLKAIEDSFKESKNSEKKAYSYAVAANAASLGYSAGYLTKQDVIQNNAKILKEVRNNYKDWETYLKDFKEGRRAHKLPEQERLEMIVDADFLENEKSPFNTMEL